MNYLLSLYSPFAFVSAGQCWFSGEEVECTSVGVIKHCIGQALLKVKRVAAVGFWRMSSSMREERSLLQLTDSGVSYKQTSLRRSHSTLLCLFPSVEKDARVSFSSLRNKIMFTLYYVLCFTHGVQTSVSFLIFTNLVTLRIIGNTYWLYFPSTDC